MSAELEFSWAEPVDFPAYEAFVREHFGAESVQAISGRARWLYWDNPFGLHVILCRYAGQIVASCGHLPLPLRIGDVETMVGCGIDMMVAEPWRRRGIGRRFLEQRLERFHISLSSGQSQQMAALYRREGARDLGPAHLARICNRFPGFQSCRAWLRDVAAWALPHLRSRAYTGRRQLVSVNKAADHLAAAQLQNGNPRLEYRLAAWFRWRYDGPIYRDYRCWLLTSDGIPPAILVTRDEPGHERLIDMVAPWVHIPQLLQTAAATSLAPTVTALVAGQPLVKDLARSGFLVRPQESSLVVLTLLPTVIDPSDLVFLAGVSDIDLMRAPTPVHAPAVTPDA